uniref:Aa_trans domain-containing protein n=1 Tax=Mesocestoides corti TaxID=53468 RepID=A0A5K3FL61_MESCO
MFAFQKAQLRHRLVTLLILVVPWVVGHPLAPVTRPQSRNECAPGWLPILFGCLFLFATWMSNCTLLGGVFQVMGDPGVVRVAYYFVGSQTIAALIYATLNLPPGLVILFFGSSNGNSYLGIFCFFSTYLDSLFCSLSLLHSFCSGLDSYLRLSRSRDREDTMENASASTTPWLKVGTPWFVAGLLATAQLATGDRDMARLTEDCKNQAMVAFTNQLEAACVVTDPNFLILRTLVTYALPLIGCLLLTGLQVRCLRQLKFVPSRHSLEPSVNSTIRRDVTLETLAPIAEGGKPNTTTNTTKYETVHECPRHGRIAYDSESAVSDDRRNIDHDKHFANHASSVNASKWFRNYRGEQLAVAINMVSCIVAVGVWSPLILSSLAYGLCHTPENTQYVKQPLYHIPGIDLSSFRPARCFIQVAASRLADFRWWVYASTGMLLPTALLVMDRDLRKACWRSLGLKAHSLPRITSLKRGN